MLTYSNTSQQWAQSSSSLWWYWQGSWWTPYPSQSHDGVHQVLTERSDLLNAVFGIILQSMIFLNSNNFVTDGSFTADVGLL